jgi:hypothetical protein
MMSDQPLNRCQPDIATLREVIASIVDPTAKFQDIDGVMWSRFEIERRELAYRKADSILALLPLPRSGVQSEGVTWRRVNDEPYEYAIQQGPHGDQWVMLLDGSVLRRSLALPSADCQTGLDWTVSEETKQHIEEIERNIREAPENIARALYFRAGCQCEHPMIKCDAHGCRCTSCGQPRSPPPSTNSESVIGGTNFCGHGMMASICPTCSPSSQESNSATGAHSSRQSGCE